MSSKPDITFGFAPALVGGPLALLLLISP